MVVVDRQVDLCLNETDVAGCEAGRREHMDAHSPAAGSPDGPACMKEQKSMNGKALESLAPPVAILSYTEPGRLMQVG